MCIRDSEVRERLGISAETHRLEPFGELRDLLRHPHAFFRARGGRQKGESKDEAETGFHEILLEKMRQTSDYAPKSPSSGRPYHRRMLAAAAGLAILALLAGWVRPFEVPGLLDLHVLSLFFVLIVAVACAQKSGLFAFAVRAVLSRVRSARALAAAAVLVTGVTAALVTNCLLY